MSLRRICPIAAAATLAGCLGNHDGATNAGVAPPAVANSVPLVVDAGPAGAGGAINHAYVTVKVCAPGSQTQCASIDHVLLDTGSSGLRLVGSVLASHSISTGAETDSAGRSIEECMSFNGGQTWGPVATLDVILAGESAAKVPVQIMDDSGSGALPPAGCGANGTLVDGVSGFNANGLLGVGVFAQDCGESCVGAATPLPVYYGCSAAGACAAENVPLVAQVTNPVALFPADNNGVVVDLPNLTNANGDLSVQGTLYIGIGTQSNNALPVTGAVVLETNSGGDFTAQYNGGAAVLPALIDSGTDAYAFDDPTIAVCTSGSFVGYYCPAVAPQSLYAVNSSAGLSPVTDTVDFAIADPNTFMAGATALIGLAGGGGSTSFTWGMPFFYGRKVYVGIDQRAAGTYTGPYFGY